MTTKHFNILKNSLEIYVCEMYSIQEKHSEEFECIFVQEKCILFKCILIKRRIEIHFQKIPLTDVIEMYSEKKWFALQMMLRRN